MVYLILVNISLIVCYTLYSLFFKKLTFFQWNRCYLLGALIISLLIPIGLFVDMSSNSMLEQTLPTIDLHMMMDVDVMTFGVQESNYYLMDFLAPLYGLGVLAFGFSLLHRLYRLRSIMRSEQEWLSFSFFNKIFLGRHLTDNSTVLSHEQVHVKQGHTYDIVLVELVRLFNWFNPVLYFYQKELKFQHECIADEICSEDKVAYAELLVAHAMNVDQLHLTNEFSNHSFLKKRIMMLFKNKSKTKHKYLYLSVLPVILVVLGSTLIFNTSKAKNIVAEFENKVADVAVPLLPGGEGQPSEAFGESKNPAEIQGPREEESIIQQLTNEVLIQEDTVGNEIFTAVEVTPEPPGGMAAFRKWIADNYRYPQAAIDAEAKGTIQISFIVEKDGILSNLKIVRDLSHGTGEAAVEMLKKSEKWSPGIQNGRKVRVAFTLPIRLDLTHMGSAQEDVKPDVLAEPELGRAKFMEWFAQEYQLPRAITSADKDPYMYVRFVVNKEGKPDQFSSRADELEQSFFNEAVRIISKSKWKPALKDGQPIDSRTAVGVKFDRDGKIIKNHTRVEVMPEPRGGMAAFQKNISEWLIYPKEMISKKEGGKVDVYFEIAKDGTPSNFKILEEPYPGVGKNLVEIIQKYGKWAPGILDGKGVVTQYSVSADLTFMLGGGVIEVKGLKGGNFIKS
ncbi:energy transducer TonB [Sphingobacterium olei]|uniref:Energy transducer TonB n=1 Tax=Sphingobacterium olei TaxID=2571155 RepID=A0A4U0P223_9SPHI|nr:M56 family metallopeptidase [Sphingobacterium olei]TJZ61259.1 energy transducer TonB [Sphingobacterium olei]